MSDRSRLLFDVTRLTATGLHTGIQRVLRCLLAACDQLARQQQCVVVRPVSFHDRCWIAHAALQPHPLQGVSAYAMQVSEPIKPGAGDVLLMFDASWYLDPWLAVDAALDCGASLVGMVHDLLPIHHPDWFRPGLSERFAAHLQALCSRADLLFAPSRVVVNQLRQRLGSNGPPIDILGHGGDFLDAQVGPASLDLLLPAVGPFHLVVSTLEPRKQHGLILDAFDILWREGSQQALVLVGSAGWCIDDLLHRLHHHPQWGRRLFHLEGVSDPQLATLYHRAQSLIYLSRDEGFGLPVLEAAMVGCPVLAADIPVLREVGGDWPSYLPVDDVVALTEAVRRLPHRAVTTAGVAGRTWRAVGGRLMRQLATRGLLDPLACAPVFR